VSYQQPPDDVYQQQARPSFTPYRQSQPPYGSPQGEQQYYQHPQQPYYGQDTVQPAQQYQQGYALDQHAYPPQVAPPQAAPPGRRAHRRQAVGKRYALCGAETFWYVLGCIGFGAAYFSKLPGKKAACEVFNELQLDGQGPSRSYSLRGMEGFWYLLMCLAFGAGYFAKVSAKKALWELVGMVQAAPGGHAEAIGRALSGDGPAIPYGSGY
jgi:hypothetical protein